MKKILLFILISVFHLAANAQSKAERELADAVERMRLAMISGDRAALNDITSADLSYGHSNGKVEGRASFVENIVQGKSDFVNIELRNQTAKITGKTALVRHELHATTNDGGKPGEVHLGVLLVWQKQHGYWKLLGRQAYKLAN